MLTTQPPSFDVRLYTSVHKRAGQEEEENIAARTDASQSMQLFLIYWSIGI